MLHVFCCIQERAQDAEAEKEVLQKEFSAERDNNQNLQVCATVLQYTKCFIHNIVE